MLLRLPFLYTLYCSECCPDRDIVLLWAVMNGHGENFSYFPLVNHLLFLFQCCLDHAHLITVFIHLHCVVHTQFNCSVCQSLPTWLSLQDPKHQRLWDGTCGGGVVLRVNLTSLMLAIQGLGFYPWHHIGSLVPCLVPWTSQGMNDPWVQRQE